jgi:hypothetical protein
LVVIGNVPFPELANSFIGTLPRIEAFLDKYEPPFIAKVYRASAANLKRDPSARGEVVRWYPQ